MRCWRYAPDSTVRYTHVTRPTNGVAQKIGPRGDRFARESAASDVSTNKGGHLFQVSPTLTRGCAMMWRDAPARSTVQARRRRRPLEPAEHAPPAPQQQADRCTAGRPQASSGEQPAVRVQSRVAASKAGHRQAHSRPGGRFTALKARRRATFSRHAQCPKRHWASASTRQPASRDRARRHRGGRGRRARPSWALAGRTRAAQGGSPGSPTLGTLRGQPRPERL